MLAPISWLTAEERPREAESKAEKPDITALRIGVRVTIFEMVRVIAWLTDDEIEVDSGIVIPKAWDIAADSDMLAESTAE